MGGSKGGQRSLTVVDENGLGCIGAEGQMKETGLSEQVRIRMSS